MTLAGLALVVLVGLVFGWPTALFTFVALILVGAALR